MSQHLEEEMYYDISMPLLGDEFPELEVQTTHGPMNIPGDLKVHGLCCSAILQISRRYARLSLWLSRSGCRSLIKSAAS